MTNLYNVGSGLKKFAKDNPNITRITTVLTVASLAIGITGALLAGYGDLPIAALIAMNVVGASMGIVSTAITVKGLYESEYLGLHKATNEGLEDAFETETSKERKAKREPAYDQQLKIREILSAEDLQKVGK